MLFLSGFQIENSEVNDNTYSGDIAMKDPDRFYWEG